MSPVQAHDLLSRHSASSEALSDFAFIRAQWQNPVDILSILMIIGGDIVRCAIAALAGPGVFPFVPVAFSFGWVAYAFSAILAAVGDGKLMPGPDCAALLVNANSGYRRTINSWILARLVRDFEPPRLPGDEDKPWNYDKGLAVYFYSTNPRMTTGVSDRDWVYYLGVGVIALQLGIAVIPGVLFGNWIILILTAGGTLLALAGAALPQWAAEKWKARPLKSGTRSVVCLTRGNGYGTVLVVISDSCGIRLEDLAAGREVRSRITVWATFVLALLWIVHLITVESLTKDAWFSLAIGGLGMLQNALAAGAKRSPGALGFHLQHTNTVRREKVFDAIKAAEDIETRVGLSLLPIFFPGELRKEEEGWRRAKEEEYRERKQNESVSARDGDRIARASVERFDGKQVSNESQPTLSYESLAVPP